MKNAKLKKLIVIVGMVVAACILVSQLLAAVLAPNPASGTPLFSASSTTGIMIITGPLLVIWAITVHLRCTDVMVSRYLELIAGLFAFWLLMVLLKYNIHDDLVTSFLWYCYYIPMTFVPVLCLFSALRAASLDHKPAVRVLKRVVLVVSFALVVFILTNNLHHLVFAFDFSNPLWGSVYRYNIGYWCAFAWYIALYLAFFAVLFPAARQHLRSFITPVIVAGLVAFTCAILYVLRLPQAFSSNFSLNYLVVVVIALEYCLDFGILPSYTWYHETFSKLPWDLKVLSDDLETDFASACAKPLSASARVALEEHLDANKSAVMFKTADEPLTRYEAYRLRGGVALLTEDISGAVRRRKYLMRQQEALRRHNAMLEQTRTIKHRLYLQECEENLYREVEGSLQSTVVHIQNLLGSLPEGQDPESVRQRRRTLVTVKLLVAYCKRKGALVLANTSNAEFDAARLQLAINESAADLRSIGVDSAALVQVQGPLPASTVSVLYDCFYDFAFIALITSNPALMYLIRDRDARTVELRAALTMSSCDKVLYASASGKLRTSLDERNVDYAIAEAEGTLNLVVTAAKVVV